MAEKEYIEREATIKALKDNVTEMESDIYYGSNMGVPKDEIEDIVNEIPTADVAEVKHGEWKEGHYEGGLLDGVNFDKCNICGYERLIEDVKYKTTYKYCPNCGAKMKERVIE